MAGGGRFDWVILEIDDVQQLRWRSGQRRTKRGVGRRRRRGVRVGMPPLDLMAHRWRANEMNERELSALKAVIKCIEEHKLDEQYPIDLFQKRVIQLEKAKADKRRAVEAAKLV
uniref:FRIGIDA-like protein n=1 Tax=Leersia perrieri TaxID=77586 RepID=A0A0D9XBJ8_9ORYZ